MPLPAACAGAPTATFALAPASTPPAAATRVSGFPAEQSLAALKPELELVAWLGRHSLLDDLVPCDLTALNDVAFQYEKRHGSPCLLFDVLASWLKDPEAMESWLAAAPPPNASVEAVAAGLKRVFVESAELNNPERRKVLRSGRRTGYSACFQELHLVSRADRRSNKGLVLSIRGQSWAWREA